MEYRIRTCTREDIGVLVETIRGAFGTWPSASA